MSQPETPQKPGIAAQLADFINNMDARAWRAFAVTIALLVVAFAILAVGRLYYADEIEHFVKASLGGAERGHWGLPATIAIFCITSLVAAPQVVLIAACVVAFGPERGFWYAWIATVASGAFTYWLGALGSTQTVRRFGGATGGRFTRFMGKNSFLASFIVRSLPTAPFIVVNVAFGAAKVNFWAYLGGLTLGVLPKTAIVAFAGDGIMDALEGKLGTALFTGVVAIVLWLIGAVLIRRLVRKGADGKDDPKTSG
jgi:uncharacterized membrane protein YdjX (TVP38/TMEM64 family)